MSDSEEDHGRALVAYLDALRGTQSMRSFMSERGYDDARVSQWRSGKPPSIQHMRELADALDVPLGEVLVAAQYGTPADFGGVREVEFRTSTIEEALDADASINESTKAAILTLLATIRSTGAKTVATRATGTRTATTRRRK